MLKQQLSLLLIISSLVSCSEMKELGLGNNNTAASQKTGTSFIELKDGTVITGKEIIYPKPGNIDFSKFDPFKKQTPPDDSIGIGNRKFAKESIYGYQDKGVFKAFHKTILLTRLRKGKLNLYSYETDAPTVSSSGILKETHVVFEKERGKFIPIYNSLEYFYETVSVNAAAGSLTKELFPYLTISPSEMSKDKLLRIVDVYNQ